MPDDDLQGEYPRICRLFPLPRVVLFPHVVLPLHIFEPRYRQMTEDALGDGDKLIALVQLQEGGSAAEGIGPPIEPVACLGRILQHDRRHDGRFDLLLLGLKRIRLVREVPSSKLYRMAEIEVLDDVEEAEPLGESRRVELLDLFRQVVASSAGHDPDLESLLSAPLSLGLLTDLLAHALGLPAATKQALLAETRVAQRVKTLVELLGRVIPRPPDERVNRPSFPPPFSPN